MHAYIGTQLIAETNSATGTRWVHNDLLGSAVARSGAGAAVLSRTQYEPYGGIASGTHPNGVGYTGHVMDAESGLTYMQQRYQDPLLGRFLSVDPVVTDVKTGDMFNRYSYADSNPYRYTDPDGRVPVPVVIAVAVAAMKVAKAGADVYKGSKLARNMAKEGRAIKKGKEATHHVIAQKAKAAEPARKVLEKHKIDIDSAANGAAVPKGEHAGMHTNKYYQSVNQGVIKADKAGGKEAVLETMKDIGKSLETPK